MNRSEFFEQLISALSSLTPEERADILNDYSEHFAAGAAAGKTEEEICRRLGDPKELAAQYLDGRQEPRQNEQDAYAKAGAAGGAGSGSPPPYYKSQNPYGSRPGAGASLRNSLMTPDTALLVIILVTVFVAVPVVSGLIGGYFGAWCAVAGMAAGGVAVIGVAIGVSKVLITTGLVLLGVALLLLAFALAVGLVALGKLLIRGIQWYVDCCKNLYRTGRFSR